MNNLPPLTERIDKGAPGGHEFERLLNQLLIAFANAYGFEYEPAGGAGGSSVRKFQCIIIPSIFGRAARCLPPHIRL